MDHVYLENVVKNNREMLVIINDPLPNVKIQADPYIEFTLWISSRNVYTVTALKKPKNQTTTINEPNDACY